MSDPLEDIKRQVREAQEDFARDADEILQEIRLLAIGILPAMGDVGYGEALAALRKVAIEAFDRCAERRR